MSRVPVRVIRAAECRRMPWKNGGGETIEIAVQPEGAGLEDFDWRLSAARVATDGPFSTFPGVDRTLAVLDGAGLELRVGEDVPVLLRHGEAPYAFAADRPTEARLLDGPIRDLNMMSRRDRVSHRVQQLTGGATFSVPTDARRTLLFCAVGALQIGDGVTLGPGDCAVFAGPGALLTCTFGPETTAYVITVVDVVPSARVTSADAGASRRVESASGDGEAHGIATPSSATRMDAHEWPAIASLSGIEGRLGAAIMRRGPAAAAFYEFLRFGVKQGWACLFGGLLLILIVASRLWYPAGAILPRYDALVIAALALQAGLLLLRLETLLEAKVILAFHVVGTAMECFKTSVGSWVYPEASVLRIGHVPLFTGFMYAAVGSYLFRVWRLFDFHFDRHPRPAYLALLSALIYANFFADNWSFDVRWPLIAAAVALFGRTIVHFKIWIVHRQMPLLLGFALVASFIWLGENLGTAGHAWLYPNQVASWTMVSLSKLSSWFLLMMISYTMVALTLMDRSAPTRSDLTILALPKA